MAINGDAARPADDAKTALAVTAQRLASIVEGSDDAIISKTLDGTVLSWNPAAERMFGYGAAEMIGRPLTTIFPPDRLDEERLLLSRISAGERVVHFETVRLRRDGTPIDVSVTLSPIRDASGIIVGASKIARDITDRKRAELDIRDRNEELEKRVAARTAEIEEARARVAWALKQAESANRAKSEFLANMSHEIRTPMNAIAGLTYLLLREVKEPRIRDRLGKIDVAAKHLLQVINDVLDLSKIGAAKMTLENIDFSVDELVADAFEMIAHAASEKGIELILDTDHMPAYLNGDPTRVRQMLVNLLSNAVKFTERGWVRLKVERLHTDSQARTQCRFVVQDTGIGVAPEHQATLFNAFEQADTTTTRRYGGTGLGLTLTRHIAGLMDGDVGMSSSVGIGSRFWFTVWLNAASTTVSTAPTQLKGLKALIVDDLPEALGVISDRVSRLGLHADAARSGPEALRKVEEQRSAGRPYDLLIVDWKMEPWDGIETLSRIRHALGTTMPRAVLMTAFDETSAREQARRVHCDIILVKPLTSSALRDGLIRALQGGQRTQPAQREESAAEAGIRRQFVGRRVLVAEDNPVNQVVARELLTAVGLTVDLAADGAEAVEKAVSVRYDLVLMDMQMPLQDGLSAARVIRSRLGAALPIVAMTASAFEEDEAACLAAGMNDYIAKPIDVARFHACIHHWLG